MSNLKSIKSFLLSSLFWLSALVGVTIMQLQGFWYFMIYILFILLFCFLITCILKNSRNLNTKHIYKKGVLINDTIFIESNVHWKIWKEGKPIYDVYLNSFDMIMKVIDQQDLILEIEGNKFYFLKKISQISFEKK